jgi:hypothetical protein
MNSPGGAATQICAPQFDRRFFSLPAEIQRQIQSKIDELGVNCAAFRIIRCGCVPIAGGRFSRHLPVQRGNEHVVFDCGGKPARRLQKAAQLKEPHEAMLDFSH